MPIPSRWTACGTSAELNRQELKDENKMAIPLSYNVRNLRLRKSLTIMTALGIALTVATAVLSLDRFTTTPPASAVLEIVTVPTDF